MSDPGGDQRIRFAVTPSAFSRSDLDEALATFRMEFAVDEGSLQWGGPDTYVILFDLSYSLLASLGVNLASSAIWDGLKYLLTRWIPKPSHYRPGETADLGLQFNAHDGTLTYTATIRTTDPDVLKEALGGLPKALHAFQEARRSGHVHYDVEEGQFKELHDLGEAGA